MISTLYEVKKAHGDFDGISIIPPDVDFDADHGYYVNFRLLVTDGSSWVCVSDTVGAATWGRDDSKDIEISQTLRVLTENVCAYLDNWFLTSSSVSTSGMVFSSPSTIEIPGADTADIFYPNDCVAVIGSKRNDGEYQVVEAVSQSLVLANPIVTPMTDSNLVTIVAQVFPLGLQAVAGSMAAFDIWTRPNYTPGIASESIGSYSYSKDTTYVGASSYPSEIVSGLTVYKRPRIV